MRTLPCAPGGPGFPGTPFGPWGQPVPEETLKQ